MIKNQLGDVNSQLKLVEIKQARRPGTSFKCDRRALCRQKSGCVSKRVSERVMEGYMYEIHSI